MSNNTTLTMLQLLDSSLWVNGIRYAISANVMLTNGFLMFLYWKNHYLLKSQCNLLIAANAVVELVIGLGLAIRATFELITHAAAIKSFSRLLCVWIGSPLTGGFAANQITILALALDRLMAVAQPFRYGAKNPRLIGGFLLLALLFFLLAIFISLLGVDSAQQSSQCSMGANAGPWFATSWAVYGQTSTLLLFAMYISMLALFWKQHRQTHQQMSLANLRRNTVAVDAPIGTPRTPAAATTEISRNAWSVTKRESQQLQRIQHRQEIRLTILVAIILLIYTFCWALPTAALFFSKLIDPLNRDRANLITFVQGFLTPFGAGLNFYLYLWNHTEIRSCALAVIFPFKQILIRHRTQVTNVHTIS